MEVPPPPLVLILLSLLSIWWMLARTKLSNMETSCVGTGRWGKISFNSSAVDEQVSWHTNLKFSLFGPLRHMAKLWSAHRAALSPVTRGPTQVAMFSFGEVSPSLHQHQPNLHKHWAQLSWLTTSSPAAESEPRRSEDGRGIPTSRLMCRQVLRMSFRPSSLPATSRNNTGECRRSARYSSLLGSAKWVQTFGTLLAHQRVWERQTRACSPDTSSILFSGPLAWHLKQTAERDVSLLFTLFQKNINLL